MDVSNRRYHRIVKATILVFHSVYQLADLPAGQQAMKNGDYATALTSSPLAGSGGDSIMQFNLGVMYDGVEWVAQDYACCALVSQSG